MRLAGETDRQLLAEVGERRLVEQVRVPLGPEVDALDEPAPGLVDLCGRPVLGEPLDDLRGGYQRVVGAERLRRVAGRTAHRDAAPVRTLLAHDHRKPRTARGRHLEAAGLGHDVVGAHRVVLVVEQVLGAPRAEVLLVGDGEIHEGATRPEARAGERAERDGHRRGQVQHVDGTATPHVTVDHLTTERIASPPVGVRGHDVGMAHEKQRGRGRVATLDARHQVLASGPRDVTLEVETGVAEILREQVDAARLMTRFGRTVVDALVANELREQIDRLVRELGVGGGHAGPDAGSMRYTSMPFSSHRSAPPACARCSRCANVSLSAIVPQCRFGNTSCDSATTVAGPSASPA